VKGLRYEAILHGNCAVGAKSVTEKTTWLVWVGGAAKRQRSPQQLPFCPCAMPCKGDGFLMQNGIGMDYKSDVKGCRLPSVRSLR